MIIQPKIRGFICTTAHPLGCAKSVQDQIDFVKEHGPVKNGPKKVLIIGASTGYGLSSRIVSAFGSGAATVGVFYERQAEEKRTATAGWYNSVAFEQKAHAAGLYAKSFNGDAFSDETRAKVLDIIKKDLGKIDLLVYSLASPRRQHPRTGVVSKSVLKPILSTYTNQTIDVSTNTLSMITLPVASADEIEQTAAVMGGEDWEFWIEALEKADLLDKGFKTVAYSYIGPELTRVIYRNGTIGKAKDHLEATARKLDLRLKKIQGQAVVSVNKAIVTQSSSAIPFIPLYFIILSKVMKEKNIEEDSIAQIHRLFLTQMYSGKPWTLDKDGLIRMDDLEMLEDVQALVKERWGQINNDNLFKISDLDGYHKEFLKLFGFGLDGVDYNADLDPFVPMPSESQ